VSRGHRVVAAVVVDAPPARVWRALTEPAEVALWDGAVPLDVPAGYPRPGQDARWRTRLGPVRLTLHDRVRAVDPERRLAASLAYGPVRVEEEYRLGPATGGGTVVVCDNDVTGAVPGLGRAAAALVGRSTRAAMAALARYCAATGP
jgi:uncharacterized protein YndB with AHSA1/START domain